MFFFSYPIFPFSLCFPSTSASLPAPFVKRQVGFHFPPFRFPLMLLKVVPSWNDTFFRSPSFWLIGRRICRVHIPLGIKNHATPVTRWGRQTPQVSSFASYNISQITYGNVIGYLQSRIIIAVAYFLSTKSMICSPGSSR